jgi:hypothetical protein
MFNAQLVARNNTDRCDACHFFARKNTALVAGIWYICQAGDIELTSPKQAAKLTYGNPLGII